MDVENQREADRSRTVSEEEEELRDATKRMDGPEKTPVQVWRRVGERLLYN